MRLRFFCATLALIFSFSIFVSPTEAESGTIAKKDSGKAYLETSNFSRGTFAGTLFDGSALRLNPGALRSGTDSTGRYNQGNYYYGRWTSPVTNQSFLEAIASWQANTPAGTWLEVELRGLVDGAWSKWYSMGVWHEHDEPFRRHSVRGQGDKIGNVAVDTLVMKKQATAVQARITLFTTNPAQTPVLSAYGITFASGFDRAGTVPSTGLTSALDVPMRSQMVYPDGGEVWCSPTSTSMVMAYWSRVMGRSDWDQTVPTVVKGVWDYVYDGGGNWPFNTAYAASMGLEGKVVRLSSLAEVERWTAAGVPVIVSIAYKSGELPGSPIPSSNGHLLVIRGFDEQGNVLTNDPAGADDSQVRITYGREDFEEAFLNHSNGTAYLIYPKGWPTPPSNGHW
ncbi:peptidase C39 family protein [Paenactinomyces guangxiensis]|uniref:Peptidase C39 family protein n=1 Tax=Paenactinomyces guangxiensis TaxID=1490290 RepID=A0A7W1WQ14_9BACL|nr:peptidase C39 family protein [Paenactinomyces guangxiensis]MBA4493962.1 peptidase C39 family protein [Paenactinomyces guangxiensis]MBH8591429.1 peptidase C39 family protein [Paenactinomyces guangxiensis]